MSLRALIIACVVLSTSTAVRAQDASANSWFVRTGFTAPYILPASPFEPSAANWVPDLTVEIGRQTNGTKTWHHLYGLPAYGVGFSIARFQSGSERGEPREAYMFFSWPFGSLTDRLDVTTDFGMGLSWNWQRMSPATNTMTPVLGSNLNALIDWGFYLRYHSTPRTSIYAGLDFTHRSNAGLVQPDKGINVLGPKIGVEYAFRPMNLGHPDVPLPGFRPQWDLVIGGSGGLKNFVEQRSPMLREDFGVFHATAELQRRFYRFGKIGGGTELGYDGATGARGDVVDGVITQWRPDVTKRLAVGAFAGYEHIIGRFGAFVDVGYNVARSAGTDPTVPRLYQRFGWRYAMNDRLSSSFAIRSIEGNKADALEVGLAYRFQLSGGDATDRRQ